MKKRDPQPTCVFSHKYLHKPLIITGFTVMLISYILSLTLSPAPAMAAAPGFEVAKLLSSGLSKKNITVEKLQRIANLMDNPASGPQLSKVVLVRTTKEGRLSQVRIVAAEEKLLNGVFKGRIPASERIYLWKHKRLPDLQNEHQRFSWVMRSTENIRDNAKRAPLTDFTAWIDISQGRTNFRQVVDREIKNAIGKRTKANILIGKDGKIMDRAIENALGKRTKAYIQTGKGGEIKELTKMPSLL